MYFCRFYINWLFERKYDFRQYGMKWLWMTSGQTRSAYIELNMITIIEITILELKQKDIWEVVCHFGKLLKLSVWSNRGPHPETPIYSICNEEEKSNMFVT